MNKIEYCKKKRTITRSLSVSTIFCVKNSSFLLSFSNLLAIFKKSRAPFRVYLLSTSRYTSTSSFIAFSLYICVLWVLWVMCVLCGLSSYFVIFIFHSSYNLIFWYFFTFITFLNFSFFLFWYLIVHSSKKNEHEVEKGYHTNLIRGYNSIHKKKKKKTIKNINNEIINCAMLLTFFVLFSAINKLQTLSQ